MKLNNDKIENRHEKSSIYNWSPFGESITTKTNETNDIKLIQQKNKRSRPELKAISQTSILRFLDS